MRKARQSLRQTDMSVLEVSIACRRISPVVIGRSSVGAQGKGPPKPDGAD